MVGLKVGVIVRYVNGRCQLSDARIYFSTFSIQIGVPVVVVLMTGLSQYMVFFKPAVVFQNLV